MILTWPRLRQHHVLRLEVAVDDAARVGLGETLRHLDREVERAGGSSGAPAMRAASGSAPHQLHRDERRPVGLVDLVDDRDRRVRERSGGTGLLLEPVAPAPARVRPRRPEDLEGDLPAEARVEGAVHDPHAAPPELLEHPVVRERPADHAVVTYGILGRKRPVIRRSPPGISRLPSSGTPCLAVSYERRHKMNPATQPDEPTPDFRATPRLVIGLAVMLGGSSWPSTASASWTAAPSSASGPWPSSRSAS